MPATSSTTGSSIASPAPPDADRTNPIMVVVLVLLCILGGIFAVTKLGSNPNETFSFVGSSIKPSDDGGAAGGNGGGQNPPGPVDPVVGKGSPTQRKIIYTAALDVMVANVDAAVIQTQSILAVNKGYVARSEIRDESASRHSATFTLRVPAENLRSLIDGLIALGTPARNSLDSNDVTEEFVDVEARIKNLKQEEETLNRLLKEKAGNVEDVLAVRRQLQPVRESIDRSEAHYKYLSAMTALSTVNLTLREKKDEVPPATVAFGDQIGTTFLSSWAALVKFGKKLTLAGVAVTAWGPVLLMLAGTGLLVARRSARSKAANIPIPPPTPSA
jgi:hypothetical protein